MIDDCCLSSVRYSKNCVTQIYKALYDGKTPYLCPSKGRSHGGRKVALTSVIEFCYQNEKLSGYWVTISSLACVAADSFPFSGGAEIEQANEKRVIEGARLGWAKKLGRSREGVSKKGEGVGRKGTACL